VKLALLGSGRMGLEVERLAHTANHEIVARLDSQTNPGGDALRDAIAGADVVVDFTRPEAALRNIEDIARAGLPMVVGTTGWYDEIDKVHEIVRAHGTGLVWAANFSIGAQALLRLVEHAAKFLDRFEEYDPYVVEHHHRGKRDTPSGTGLRLAEKIIASMSRKDQSLAGNPAGRIPPRAVHVASVRAGEAFGQHKVGFDAAAESIELTLTARSREGFARGALYAAEWIRQRTGVFEFSELFEQVPLQ
jgi:4-hydroxy-tetrahydrodipicolinate reductase